MGFFSGTAAIMVAGTLYTYPDNFRAQKALIAAKYSGAQLTVAKDFVFGETNKSPEFLKKLPLGKVPAFEGSDGVLLTESNAIAYYVANDELRGGSDASARAQVVQWMAMADNEILPAACTWVFPTMGIMQFNKNATERAKEDVKTALKCLNDHLLTRTFLVGERLTLADIAVATTMLSLYKQVLDPAFRKPFVNVTRWFTTVVNQPNAKAVLGPVTLCTKMAEFDAKKFAEFSGKGDKKAEKKEKAPKQEQKKPEKKPEKKKEKKEDAEPEADVPPEPKKADPFEKMPKGTFDLEEWKRFYSNNDEPSLLPGSGSISTTRTIPSGAETTSTMTWAPWSSCLAISSEECSRDWTNSTKMPSAPCVCSVRTTTPPSAVSGYLGVMSSLSSLTTAGKSWTVSLMTARSWWISTGSGREQMRRAEPSIREKYSSEDQGLDYFLTPF